MTQPIQEPSTPRALSQSKWSENQLFRRPAPPGAQAGLPYCWMAWDGPQAITVSTITNPAGAGPDYIDGLIVDADNLAGFSLNFATGCVRWSEPGEYGIMAWVQWDGGATVGSTLAGILDFGQSCTFSTYRFVSMIVSDTINESMRIPLFRPEYDAGANHDSVRILCYHNDAGGQDLASAEIHVWQISPVVIGES